MSKKKKEELEEELDSISEENEEYFDYHDTAYMPYLNEETNRYEILLIRVNKDTLEAVVEREYQGQTHPSKQRAVQDILKRIADNMIKNK